MQILSTVARVSTGAYEPIIDQTRQWRRNRRAGEDSLERAAEQNFLTQYLTPLLRCGKPASVSDSRWFCKTLSNDQTAFTGFTSLVDIVEEGRGNEQIGYRERIRLLPTASFVEPFVLRQGSAKVQEQLWQLQQQLCRLDSTKAGDVVEVLREAEAIAPVAVGRKRGKAPIFFYSVTDQPFVLPRRLYERMALALDLIVEGLQQVATRFTGNLDAALFGSSSSSPGSFSGRETERQFFTGSVDFMVEGEDIYLIDIGAPAVGYIADILYASKALGREPDVGFAALASVTGKEIEVYQGLSRDLGFFDVEVSSLVNGLRIQGIRTQLIPGASAEVRINGQDFPTTNFDYLTRYQPLRNRVLRAMQGQLQELGVYASEWFVNSPMDDQVERFYSQTWKGLDMGVIVKKRSLFTEYLTGSNYNKPLVTPLWLRESRQGIKTSTIYERFVPSLLDVEIAGAGVGRRSFEIRLYYCGGRQQ